MNIRAVVVWSLVLSSTLIFAQSKSSQNSSFYKVIQVYISEGEAFEYDDSFAYSAILVESATGDEIAIRLVHSNQNTHFIADSYKPELHLPQNFLFLNKTISSFKLIAAKSGDFIIHLYDGQTLPIFSLPLRKKSDLCSEPSMIDQDLWRSGLPEPIPGRIEIETKHCIVHHSAGSNQITDFTAAVRSIYLLHTQTNGWDDIGYNILIAPNGDIYSGRDGLNYADDEVQGAHFCSKNNKTFGICLIGSYQNQVITDSMNASLIHTLTWKLYKENLDAFDQYAHPDAQSALLGSIAFHRDGCSTICPGDSVYQTADDLTLNVHWELNICRGISSLNQMEEDDKSLLYPQPASKHLYLNFMQTEELIEIRSITGQEVQYEFNRETKLLTFNLPDGLYIILFSNTRDLLEIRKFIISN